MSIVQIRELTFVGGNRVGRGTRGVGSIILSIQRGVRKEFQMDILHGDRLCTLTTNHACLAVIYVALAGNSTACQLGRNVIVMTTVKVVAARGS
jgi:hypothetical protein